MKGITREGGKDKRNKEGRRKEIRREEGEQGIGGKDERIRKKGCKGQVKEGTEEMMQGIKRKEMEGLSLLVNFNFLKMYLLGFNVSFS